MNFPPPEFGPADTDLQHMQGPLREEVQQAWLRSYGWGKKLAPQAERLGEIASAVGRLQKGLARAVLEKNPEDEDLLDFLNTLAEELDQLSPKLQASGRPGWQTALIGSASDHLHQASQASDKRKILASLDRAGNRLFWFRLFNRVLRGLPLGPS